MARNRERERAERNRAKERAPAPDRAELAAARAANRAAPALTCDGRGLHRFCKACAANAEAAPIEPGDLAGASFAAPLTDSEARKDQASMIARGLAAPDRQWAPAARDRAHIERDRTAWCVTCGRDLTSLVAAGASAAHACGWVHCPCRPCPRTPPAVRS